MASLQEWLPGWLEPGNYSQAIARHNSKICQRDIRGCL